VQNSFFFGCLEFRCYLFHSCLDVGSRSVELLEKLLEDLSAPPNPDHISSLRNPKVYLLCDLY
jgi:hypothetical protein